MIGAEETEKVIAQCAKYYGLLPNDLFDPCRETEIVVARHAAWAILRHRGVTISSLARLWLMDRKTVRHGIGRGQKQPLNRIVEEVIA